MLELYHWAPNGPWLKPLIVIAEKAIDCRLIPVDILAFEQYGERMPEPSLESRFNCEGEGPLLVHDGRQITESFFMSEYLDIAFGGASLQPGTPVTYNMMLAGARFINETLMPAVNLLGCQRFLAPTLPGKSLPPAIAAKIPLRLVRDGWSRAFENDYPQELVTESLRKVALGLQKIDAALGDGEWVAGDSFSLADIDYFATCRSLRILTPDQLANHPRVVNWLARVEDRPAVRQSLATGGWESPETAFAPGPEHARWG